MFTGEETLGVGCGGACARVVAECGIDPVVCATVCAEEPRAVTDCWFASGSCELEEDCGSIHP